MRDDGATITAPVDEGDIPAGEPGMVEPGQDCPLAASLQQILRIHGRSISRHALVAGMPLDEGKLTPGLFVRAAERAALSAKIAQRKLSDILPAQLPVVLLLNEQTSCVLVKRDRKSATILMPESGDGEVVIALKELNKLYSGSVILAKPVFDYNATEAEHRTSPKGHWFWSTIRTLWPEFLKVLLASAMVNLLALAAPLFIMNVYDRVLPNEALPTLWVLAIGFGMAVFFDFLLKVVRNVIVDVNGRRADLLLASRLFDHVLHLKMRDRPGAVGAFANQMRDYEFVREFFTASTIVVFADLLFLGLFLFVIHQIAPPLVWVPVTALVLAVVTGLMLQVPLRRAMAVDQGHTSDKQGLLIEALSGIETIKALGAEGRMQRQWELINGASAQVALYARYFSSISVTLTQAIQQLVTVGIVVGGTYLFIEGDVSMGAIIACVILSGRAVAPLSALTATIARSQQAFTALRSLNAIMALPEERPDAGSFVSRDINKGDMEFRNVTFSYADGAAPSLNGVSLKIKAGERVGLIGRVGSGKTTLIRLMMRLYDPDEGAVLIDGIDAHQYHPVDIRRGIGSVLQEVVLFRGSVKDNVSFGVSGLSDDQIIRSARIAGLDEFLDAHPQGYSLDVGERGHRLSGGQRQLVGLARALVTDPPVLVFDEPTSSMDNATEAAFVRRLGAIAKDHNQTLIIATHRSSLLDVVDRLIVIENGKIAADGPKEKVLAALRKHATGGSALAGTAA